MAPDDLTLEAGARLLHIGPHKTGTTAIQGAFDLARGRLAEYGVVYAGAARQPMRATLAVTGRPAMLGEAQPDMAYWDRLVHSIRAAGDQRVVISSEFFADGDDEAARRAREAFDRHGALRMRTRTIVQRAAGGENDDGTAAARRTRSGRSAASRSLARASSRRKSKSAKSKPGPTVAPTNA